MLKPIDKKHNFTLNNLLIRTFACGIIIGNRVETGAKLKGAQGHEMEGVRGLKALGVRDLSYKLAYLACTVTPTSARVSITY